MGDAADQQAPRRQRSGSLEGTPNGDNAKRQRTTRGKGLRTRSGCTSCRTRRVKCDEAKPICAACVRRDDDCVYPSVDETASQRQNGSNRGASKTAASRPTVPERKIEVNSGSNASGNRSAATPRSTTGEGQEDCSARSAESDIPVPSQPKSALSLDPSDRFQDTVVLVDQPVLQHNATGALPTPPAWYQSLDQNIESDPEGWQIWAASPESSWSNPPGYTAETASRLWFGLLANDATTSATGNFSDDPSAAATCAPTSETTSAVAQNWVEGAALKSGGIRSQTILSFPEEAITLDPDEVVLFRHFVLILSTWLDITDPERSFAVVVTDMALRNRGVMCAILALSARHLSICPTDTSINGSEAPPETLAVKYYSHTLQYLQRAMQHAPYLTSDELLATVLVISAYEMLDTEGRDWERHLKGVFWIQRSQLIHGESEGLKRCIWWAWLRQDIWAAFKERRKILSFYVLKRPCSELDFWELVNRSVFLLGQCVNYASDKEIQAGAVNTQARIARGRSLWASLEEWNSCFAPFDRRLPTLPTNNFPFTPIWINPPAASLAVQVHHFARLLLLDLMPAIGGLAELTKRAENVRESVAAICGIAYCTTESAAMLTSTQCLYAARPHLNASHEVDAVNELLLSHQKQTGWPNGDIHLDVR
ncbi:hypothetical protein CLAFUW4_05343 [Fulvia fulva]|uniref:Zn(2)-C6 fungal-type domain-containing protein n=1 Tax=Passalora fulva TaxID=5499 RepID=A0A9Q8P8T8_PASFU|nr:uncharacterized protein CLAFUR5_05491 [Fulvia fulva]KAK4623748.1 hypothetical protein CLAFUR4_05337 [Fulvia fulva]KAK4625985.1 hypothetical protein CLAFUR0_05345 [Fulvia fulva]UJO17564.1 hypothetical protein CLAFUR5_05491 [Fulvia fulva]WPV14701.1 hypothetical protein CLAFUW4_05343 [Fulvia fulva]WPV30175.1 hypothetical protein CLAFUW7_05341 [Fulvia fulva]